MNAMSKHHEAQEQAADWLSRRDRAGDAWNSRDEAELAEWLAQNPAHRIAWLRLKTAWGRADGMAALPPAATKRAQAPSNRWRSSSLLVGASATAVLAVAFVMWQGGSIAHHGMFGSDVYSTSVGGREAVVLDDGSKLTLNTDSRLRVSMMAHERHVWLERGEAFFDVSHDRSRPFVVSVGVERIVVLGTKFNVRRDGDQTKVTVLEGVVRLERDPSAISRAAPPPTELRPRETAVTRSQGVMLSTKTERQMQQELSWREGRLTFDQMTLAEIAAEFNRYNRRQFVVAGDAADIRLGGSFDAHNIDGFTRLLHDGFGLQIRNDGNLIHLSKD